MAKKKKGWETLENDIKNGTFQSTNISTNTTQKLGWDALENDLKNNSFKTVVNSEEDMAPVNNVNNQNKWFTKGVFEDGYDAGDVVRTILGTAGDFTTSFANGALNVTEGIGDLIGYGIAGVIEKTGNKELADSLREEYGKNMYDEWFKPSRDILNESSVLGDKADNITGMAGSIGLNVALGGVGLGPKATTALTSLTNGLSTAGSSMGEAYRNGATNDQAIKYGLISGTSSAMVNLLVGGASKAINATGISNGVGKLDDKFAQALTQKINNQLVRNFAEAGIKATGEGFESVLQGVIDAGAKKLTYMSDSDINDLIEDENLLNKFVTGAVTSAIMQTPGVMRTAVSKENIPVGKDADGNIKYKTKYGLKDKEAVRDYISGLTKNEQAVYDKEVEKRIDKLTESEGKVTAKQKNKIRNEVKEDLAKGYIKSDTIEEALGGKRYEQLKRFNDAKNNLEKQISSLQKKIGNDTDNISDDFSFEEYNDYSRANLYDRKTLETLQNDLKETDDKISKIKSRLSDEVYKNTANDDFLQESYNEILRKRDNYQIDPTREYTERGQAIVQKAVDSGVLNNSRKTHEFVDMLAKVSEDKGLDFDFVNNRYLKDSDLSINGYFKDGKVNINIDSEKSLNTILGHEITHALEDSGGYNNLPNMIKSYLGQEKYNSELDKIKNRYGKGEDVDIEKELTSDFIGEHLFTDKDFIENLSKNRNTFTNIYDEVKYLKDVATAGSKEKRQLTKIEHTFNDIYKDMPKLEGEIDTNSAIGNQNQNTSKNTIKTTNTDDPYEEFGRENGTGITDEEIAPTNIKYALANKENNDYNISKSVNGKLIKYNYDNPDINAILAVDEKAKKYLNYTRDSKFLELKEEQRDYLSSKASHTANELYQNPDAKDAITDGIYEAKVRLIDGTANYEIYDTKPIRESVGVKYGEREDGHRISSDSILGEYNERRQGFGNRDSESTRYREETNTDDGLASGKLPETRSDETKNNAGKGKRNSETRGLDNSSFSLQQRVFGDELLDAQDLIKELKDVGAEIDENGYVTLYHQTTKDSANKIKETGQMVGKENGIFFSTSKNAQQSTGRGNEKLKFKIPVEELQIDDIFDDNADVKIPLKNYKTDKLDVSKYIVDDTKYSLNDKFSNLKQQQLDIINKSNPAPDDYHTWVRSTDDIKTFEEAFFEDGEYSGFDPDFTEEMAQKSIDSGKITVYSSYPIKDGVFVSPSKMEASQYAGSDDSKLYSKTVNIDDVAWIDGAEGQYAKIDGTKHSLGNDDKAPIGNYNVYGDDIKIEQDKAPYISKKDNLPKDPTREDSYDFVPTKEQANKNKEMTISSQKTPWRKAKDKFKRLFINSNAELDNLAKESDNQEIKYKADMLNNVYAEAQSNIEKAQTDNYGKAIGKSINQLFEPAKENGLDEAFNDYLIHYSNIDRHHQGKGSTIPENVSQQIVYDYEKEYPEFKEWGKDVWQYGKNAKSNLKEAGLISQELSDKLDEMYPHYVPYIVDKKDLNNYIDDIGEIKPKNVIGRAKGNAYNMLPVEKALTKYTYAQKNSVRQNELYSEVVSTLYDDDNPVNSLTLDNDDPSNIKGNLYRDEKGNYLTAFVDGKEKSVRISDDLYKTLNRDTENYIKDLESDFEIVTKPLQKISSFRRNLLTKYSPTFPIKNALKDVQDATFNSKYTKDFIKNYPSAFSELRDNNNELANQFKSLYGSGNLMGEYDVDSGLYNGNLKNDSTMNKLAKVNDIVELAPRYAEFKSSIENGASVQEAMYNAREVTTNFSRGGVITKALNRNGFTFLNANVQGTSKFIRNLKGENGTKGIVNSLIKTAALSVAPAIFNDLAFGSGDNKDEDYEALPNYVKDNYYLIKTNGNNFIRIPKGRSLSVFGSFARRSLEYMNGDANAFDGFLQNAKNQVGVSNPEENFLLEPFIQAYGSENGTAWYGGDLVPTRLQSKPKAEQYDETTDEFSKWLGEKLNQSPYKINYLIDQYSGGIGDILLPMITQEATSEDESIGGRLLAPIKDQFVVDSTSDNKYVSSFYDKNDELTVQANSYNATDDDLLKKKYMSSVSSELSKLYAERHEVQNDNSLSRSERYKKSQAIKDEINKLAKEGLNTYSKVDKTDSYAVIGDREYYKNTKNEWTKVNDSELNSLRAFGLTTNEKNSYFNTKNTISNITNNYKTSLANATDDNKDYINNRKKREIVNAIKNSNLTNDAKAYLYNKNYADTDTMNALVGLDMNMDSYMEFDSQLFESDKYVNGKTVPNSKRNKIFNYINQMNIPFEQKLILAKLKYNNYDDYNYEIINYLNKSNLDYGTQVKLLRKMGFNVYEDGRITW